MSQIPNEAVGLLTDLFNNLAGLDSLEQILTVLPIILPIICSLFIAFTDTRSAWWYKIIEWIALNFGKAKNKA